MSAERIGSNEIAMRHSSKNVLGRFFRPPLFAIPHASRRHILVFICLYLDVSISHLQERARRYNLRNIIFNTMAAS